MEINIIIAGRKYPLNVPENEEEVLRRVGKQIDQMIKRFETEYAIKDKQDALAMCALRMGVNAEMYALNLEKNIKSSAKKLADINHLLEELEK